MLNKIYIHNIITLFVLTFYIVAITFYDTSLRYGRNMHGLLQMQSLKLELNMYFKTKI